MTPRELILKLVKESNTIAFIHQSGDEIDCQTNLDPSIICDALREARQEALEEQASHCLCTRNTYGFDYGETHKKLGKASIGARWLTPKDIAQTARALKTYAAKGEE